MPPPRQPRRLGPAALLLLVCVAALALQEAWGFAPAGMPARGAAHISSSSGRRTLAPAPRVAAAAAASGDGSSGAAEEEVAVVVEGARAHTLLPGALATHGRLFRNGGDQAALTFVAPNEEVGVNLVAGTVKGSGEPVVAFVSPQTLKGASKGSTLRVRRSAVVGRPAAVGAEDACLLPYHALSLLPQLMKAGIHDKGQGAAGAEGGSDRKKVCIVTGAGPDARFAIQVLRAWECKVVACSRRDAEALKKLGAEAVVDFSKESFSERFPSYAAVVDTVGTDVESIAANLMNLKGAAYVSTMPSSIRRMQEKGLLQGASTFFSVFGGKAPEAAPTNAHWLPEKPGLEVVEYALKLGPSLSLGGKPPGMDDYWDAILWPKDAELNYRFGFPAPPPQEEAGDDGRGGRRGDDAALLREYTRRRGGGQDEDGE